MEKAKTRFLTKIQKNAKGCWLWQAGVSSSGYGAFFLGGRQRTAHRVSFLLFNGPIEDGLQVLHTCDVKLCVNPAHLFVGTQQDNINDMWRKGRAAVGTALNHGKQQGEHNNAAKVTVEQVRSLRSLVAQGVSIATAARSVGVDRVNAWAIVRRKSWAHLP